MDVSIIIPSFNTRDLTLGCIFSIVKYTKGVDYEIVVVDNGSIDKTQEAVKKRFPKVYVIKNKNNLGFAKACNQGIEISKGKYVLFLNSDTEVTQGAIYNLIDFAKKTADAGVVGSMLLNSDGTIQQSAMHFPTVFRAVLQYWMGEKHSFEFYIPSKTKASEVEAVVGASFLITPVARQKVGVFNEQYFMYYEDLDYCRRVKKAGLKVYYLPSSRVVHYHGKSGKNVVKPAWQWKRLIPSSKIYHGVVAHTLIVLIIWSSQRVQKIKNKVRDLVGLS